MGRWIVCVALFCMSAFADFSVSHLGEVEARREI